MIVVQVLEFLTTAEGAQLKAVHGAQADSMEALEAALSREHFSMTAEFVSPVTGKKERTWIRYGAGFFDVCTIPVGGLILALN